MAFCKSVDGGSSRHFSLQYIYSSGNPPKKKSNPLSLTSRTSHRNFPAPLFHLYDQRNRTSAPHFSGGLSDPPQNQTPPQPAPASTAPDYPRRASKPYTHPKLLRSRSSCGLVHPTGAVLPTPSSTTPDLAHQLPRSPHLNRFTDAAVHEPDLLHRCRCARV